MKTLKNILSLKVAVISLLMTAASVNAQNHIDVVRGNESFIDCKNLMGTRDGNIIAACPLSYEINGEELGYQLYKVSPQGEFLDSLFIEDAQMYRVFMAQNPNGTDNVCARVTYNEPTAEYLLKINTFTDSMQPTGEATAAIDTDMAGASLMIDANGDIVLTYKNDLTLYFVKVGLDGTIKAQENIGMYSESSVVSPRYSVCQNVAANQYAKWYSNTEDEQCVVIVDSDFNEVSHNRYQRLSEQYHFSSLPGGNNLVWTSADTYLMTMVLDDLYSTKDHYACIAEFQAGQSNPVVKKIFESDNEINSIGLELAGDGGYYYSYMTNNQVVMVRMDANFNENWVRYCFNTTDSGHLPSHMIKLEGGEIVVGGSDSYISPETNQMFLLIFTDNCGNEHSTPEIEQCVRPYTFYPNPVAAEMQFKFSPDVKPVRIEVLDQQGRCITENADAASIDLSRLSAGQYFVRVSLDNGKVYTDKIVKE